MEHQPKSRLEELQEFIIDSPTSIEAEFSRSANDWLSCFGTRVFVIETILHSRQLKAALSAEHHKGSAAKLEKLKVRLQELKGQYSGKENTPPEEIRKELLGALDVLK